MDNRKTIAITCGEPAGIGPEIGAAAWSALKDQYQLIWIGDPTHLPNGVPTEEVPDPSTVAAPDKLAVVPIEMTGPRTFGSPNPEHAKGVITAIETAVDLAQSGHVDAICTAPINKAALVDGAGFAYPGHTEFLAALAGDTPVVMMLACDALRVVPATIHIPLSEVPAQLTAPLLRQTIEITEKALKDQFGIESPPNCRRRAEPTCRGKWQNGTRRDRSYLTPTRPHAQRWIDNNRPPVRRHDVPCRSARGL